MKSARQLLSFAGKIILVTTVDSPHYEGAFQFEEVASKAGFTIAQKFDFDPSKFSGYHHTMTNQDDSALENHSRFVTRIFRVKS